MAVKELEEVDRACYGSRAGYARAAKAAGYHKDK